jgi:hypothetical protein
MKVESLKKYLRNSIKKYSGKSFAYFFDLYVSENSLYEEFDEEGQLEVRVQQFYEDKDACWLDVFLLVSDEDIELMSNIVFHKDGNVELPKRIFITKFNGLAKPIDDV